MSGDRSGRKQTRGPRPLIAITEKYLRKRHVLAADEQLIEFKVGKVQQWATAGSRQPLPRAFARLDIRQLRGISSCSYSSQRLFLVLGSEGTLVVNLAYVWHADSQERSLRLVLSAPKLTGVRWEPDAGVNDSELAGFAERIMAQRDRALAEMPPESRQKAAHHLAGLTRSGLLAAALAEQEAPPVPSDSTHPGSPALPRTYVGRWLRAALLDQRELRDQLAKTVNGGAGGWNDDVPVVVQIASELLADGYFGPVPDDQEIVWMAGIIQQGAAEDRPTVDHQTAQAVIKSALGFADAVDITRADRLFAMTLLTCLLAQLLNLQEATVDVLVGEAERTAFERGAYPPVVPDVRLAT